MNLVKKKIFGDNDDNRLWSNDLGHLHSKHQLELPFLHFANGFLHQAQQLVSLLRSLQVNLVLEVNLQQEGHTQ